MKPVRVILHLAVRCRDCPPEKLHVTRLVVDAKDVDAVRASRPVVPCPEHRFAPEAKKPAEAG